MASYIKSITTSYERLVTIDWEQDISHLRSNVALMREYLRRSARWAEILNSTPDWPFTDFSAYLQSKSSPPDEMVQDLAKRLDEAGVNEQFREICLWVLNWAAQDPAELEAIANFPDPYEPLVRFFERRGHFYRQHGFIYVEHVGIPALNKGWEHFSEIEPIAGLDDTTLDKLD